MTEAITHAAVGGPPDDWQSLQVRDLESGQLVDAVEVNTEEGWAIVMSKERPKPGDAGWPKERITGRFAIERQPGK
jgi:hypothetical protein